MSTSPRSGISLVELLIALTILELLATATLHAVLHTQRIARNVAATGAIDEARLEAVRVAAASPSCRDAPTATLRPLALPAQPMRPALTVMLRCGR